MLATIRPWCKPLRAPVTIPRSTRSTRGSVMTSEWIPKSRRSPRNRSISFGTRPQADLERGPILDDARDVSGDLLGSLTERLVKILDDRVVDRHDLVEPVERDLGLGPSTRHGGIDLGDHAARRQQRRSRDVDRHAEAAHTSGVRGAHLNERHIEGKP